MGRRLCTASEASLCCGTGCNFDFSQVWTSTVDVCVTAAPTAAPSSSPTVAPTVAPTALPTSAVVTAAPTASPTAAPSAAPSEAVRIDACAFGGTSPAECAAVTSTAAVRCCDLAGTTCVSRLGGGQCVSAATYDAAAEQCAAVGRRLCTASEAILCCGTGCNFDVYQVWTSTVDVCVASNGALAAASPGPALRTACPGHCIYYDCHAGPDECRSCPMCAGPHPCERFCQDQPRPCTDYPGSCFGCSGCPGSDHLYG